LRKLVLSADEQELATQRVLARYGITSDHYFASPEIESDRPHSEPVAGAGVAVSR
jgi:hypothetical protein